MIEPASDRDYGNWSKKARSYASWLFSASQMGDPEPGSYSRGPTHRFVETNGIRMHLAEQGEGPLVLLCHGFPELWYSWRYQLSALAAAGFRAVAPDMRGYGQTDRPEAIDQYTLLHLVGDMVGVLDAVGHETAVIAGLKNGA